MNFLKQKTWFQLGKHAEPFVTIVTGQDVLLKGYPVYLGTKKSFIGTRNISTML
jgi:hypothetical protein